MIPGPPILVLLGIIQSRSEHAPEILVEQADARAFFFLERTPAVAKAAERIAAVAQSGLGRSSRTTELTHTSSGGSMADDIEAELKAAGKELDKVRHGCADAACAANKPPGRGNRAYVGRKP